MDLALCVVVAPVAAVLMAGIALAIRVDSPGPALFRQARTGRNGVRFSMFKFRTMVKNAEALKPTLMHLNVLPPPDFKIPDDPRITRVGKFLRRSSLDELPQVINIFLGQMSWVGPRPTSFRSETYDVWHAVRLEVPPGLTGLWQVRMRHSSTFDERVRLDVEYIESSSLMTDLRILIMTALSVVRRTGA
jgi:lipopolysaccharide/colanic/teichoic acid biosynthesis glycosyltransferase